MCVRFFGAVLFLGAVLMRSIDESLFYFENISTCNAQFCLIEICFKSHKLFFCSDDAASSSLLWLQYEHIFIAVAQAGGALL